MRYRKAMKYDGISKWRYEELKAFCRQYEEKKHKLDSAIGIQSPQYDSIRVQSGGIADRVLQAVAIREPISEDITQIDKVAGSIEGGKWEQALILHLGYGVSYECLVTRSVLPTNNRQSFFRARKLFFQVLNEVRRAS